MEHSTDITSNRLEFVSSTKAMLYIEANEAQFTYITEYDVTIDETNKTITFNSFNLTMVIMMNIITITFQQLKLVLLIKYLTIQKVLNQNYSS